MTTPQDESPKSQSSLVDIDRCDSYAGLDRRREYHICNDADGSSINEEAIKMNNCRYTNHRPLFALLALTACFAGGCDSKQAVVKKSNFDDKIAVRTVAVEQTDVKRTTQQPASVHANYRAEIRSRADGYVTGLMADIGDYVKAGAALAEIDVPEMEKQLMVGKARVRRFQAEEMQAEAGVNLASAQLRSSQAKLDEAKSQMDRVEASLAASEAEFSRTQDLVQRGSLQNRVLDEVRMRRDSEQASKLAVKSSIDSAEAEVGVAEAMLVSAKADLAASVAETEISNRELEELEVLIAYATIKAPFDGVVTHRGVELGDLVKAAENSNEAGPLFVVSQINRVRIRVPIPESDAPLVSVGDQLTVTFPSFESESPINATVTRRAGSLDPSTRTMLIEAEVDNEDGKLIPGMFGQATIQLAAKVAANCLPSRAIRFGEDGKAYVYIVGDDDKVTVKSIQTGFDDGSTIEVVSGLEPEQVVIDSHLKRFTDGQQVAVLSR